MLWQVGSTLSCFIFNKTSILYCFIHLWLFDCFRLSQSLRTNQSSDPTLYYDEIQLQVYSSLLPGQPSFSYWTPSQLFLTCRFSEEPSHKVSNYISCWFDFLLTPRWRLHLWINQRRHGGRYSIKCASCREVLNEKPSDFRWTGRCGQKCPTRCHDINTHAWFSNISF